MLKLLITAPWGNRLGGAEEMLWNIMRNLDTSAFAATVILLEPGPFERELAELAGVTTAVIPAARLRNATRAARTVERLARMMRRSRPDLIVNWTPKAQLYGAPAATMAGLGDRVVWWQHGIAWGHWMERVATILPARAVGCSSDIAAAAQLQMLPRRRTFAVNPGIDAQVVSPLSKEALGIPADRVVLGNVGRLQPQKRQDMFLRTVAILRDRGQDVHGLLVGGVAHGLSPHYHGVLADLIEELQLSDRITMTGQVHDAQRVISAMDIFVNVSLNESFGIVILEAMAQGVPVVAVKSGGPAAIIEDGVSGVLVGDDCQAVASVIESLIRDDELRVSLGEAGQRVFSTRYTARAMTNRVESMLSALATESAT